MQLQRFERRWELPNRPAPIYDYPLNESAVATSLFWYCAYCGVRYAEVRCWKDAKPAIWHGVSGCCLDCAGSRFSLPGSVEAISLIRDKPPLAVLSYQLSLELDFLKSKDHPYNVES